jgi:hypothetical protein
MAEHVRAVLHSCAQTLYALKVLRSHGLPSVALHNIYQSVVVAKVMHAASAWWGFTTQSDRQRIDSFFQRGVRCGLCPVNLPTFTALCQKADDKLFYSILNDNEHVLHRLLPPKSNAFQLYNLRPRTHDRQLPEQSFYLNSCNFIHRLLYANSY